MLHPINSRNIVNSPERHGGCLSNKITEKKQKNNKNTRLRRKASTGSRKLLQLFVPLRKPQKWETATEKQGPQTSPQILRATQKNNEQQTFRSEPSTPSFPLISDCFRFCKHLQSLLLFRRWVVVYFSHQYLPTFNLFLVSGEPSQEQAAPVLRAITGDVYGIDGGGERKRKRIIIIREWEPISCFIHLIWPVSSSISILI